MKLLLSQKHLLLNDFHTRAREFLWVTMYIVQTKLVDKLEFRNWRQESRRVAHKELIFS